MNDFIISAQRTASTVINEELIHNSGLIIVINVYKDTEIEKVKDGIILNKYEYIIRCKN